MAKIDDLFDAGRGKLGNLVVYRMNGMGIVRTKPKHIRDSKSPAQMAQRQRLQVVNDFMRPFLKLFRITFVPETAGRTARAEAQSYIMRNVLAGEYPNIYVDKSKALLSHGPLPVPVSATVTAQPEGLLIEWENDADAIRLHPNDTLVVMALSADGSTADYSFTQVKRTEGRYTWKPALPDGAVEIWIAFRNREQTKMSDSVYAGEAEG